MDSLTGIIEKSRKHGIFTHGTLVVGMPGETIEDINETFSFVLNNLELTSISTFIAAPIPGSELFHQALDKGLVTREKALLIDTTKCKMSLSDVDPTLLEKMVMDFQEKVTKKAKEKNPKEFQRKYRNLIRAGRMTTKHGGRLT